MSELASELTGAGRHQGDPGLYRGKVALVCFFICEAHMFGCLIIAFLFYLNDSRHSSTPPAQVLHLPMTVGATICLLASSGTILLALRALRRDALLGFALWWLLTIGLGVLFLLATAHEWYDLIVHHGLTPSVNYLGTTYFPLVGLHAVHVTAGVLVLSIILVLGLGGSVSARRSTGAELVSWYWHFVDVVWILIFLIVYVASR